MIIVLIALAALAALIFWSRTQSAKFRQEKTNGIYSHQFVYINEDGTARELTADEHEYLNTIYHGADGARPYIKERYQSLTPDKKIWGYLLRRQLPPGMLVSPS
jgi:hypothetical protein